MNVQIAGDEAPIPRAPSSVHGSDIHSYVHGTDIEDAEIASTSTDGRSSSSSSSENYRVSNRMQRRYDEQARTIEAANEMDRMAVAAEAHDAFNLRMNAEQGAIDSHGEGGAGDPAVATEGASGSQLNPEDSA